jgi:kanamycin kinase
MVAGSPRDDEAPTLGAIAAMAAGDHVRPVWRNELGGLTFEVTGHSGRRFVKWAPVGSGLDLTAEAARLRWAAPFTPVPTVLGEGRDSAGSWLITAGLAGATPSTRSGRLIRRGPCWRLAGGFGPSTKRCP